MEPKSAPLKKPDVFRRTFSSAILYRDYRLLWMGSWTEHMGEWMETTALLWLLNQLTGSPLMGTLFVSLRHMPLVIFAFVGGVIVDRLNRRAVLIGSLLASALVSLATAALVYTGLIQWWHILANGALAGVITGFNHPARHTLLPNLVKKEHLLNAVTLDSGSVTASRIIGAPLAGFIIAIAGSTTPVLGLKAVGAFVAIFWLSWIKAPPTPAEAKKKSPVANFVQGLQYVGSHRDVLTQILLYLLPYFVTNTYTGLLPYFATNVLDIGPELYGLLNAAPGAGALATTLVLAALVNLRRKHLVLLLGGICQGVALLLFAISPFYLLSLFLLLLVGASNTIFMTLNNTIVQQMIPDQVRGRVMSLREVSSGVGPGGSLISGALAEAFSGQLAVGLAGVLAILVLLSILLFSPVSRRPTTPQPT
ncbi:MAG: MFS transporter [Chloroflexi bacterium]|nr:MFS transporter [Chloroflexota bacterium]